MPAVNDITNQGGQFATAFGLHLVQGFPFLHESVATTGEQKQVTLLQGLGDGHGAGWDGAQELTYKQHRLDPAVYHFHPGLFSKGTDDPVQGVDSFFPDGITYNGTAYVGVRLPDGLAANDDISQLQGIYRCLRLPDFNATGQQIDRQGNVVVLAAGETAEDYYFYSANPARVAAFLILVARGLPKSKVDWPAWCAWRDYCQALISWLDGRSTRVGALTWQTGNGMTVGDGGSAYKSRTTTGVGAWDSGTVTETALPVNSNARGLQFTLNNASGGYMVGVTKQTDLPGSGYTYTGLDCALYFEIGGALKVYQAGTLKGTLTGGWTTGQTYRVVDDAGTWKFYRNGTLITHSLSLSAPPAGALYGGIACNPPNSGITAASFNPATGDATGARLIPRFEAHIAFTGETDLLAALDQVCFMACADYQIKGRKIRFLTPEPCAPKGTSPAHAAQREIVHHFDGTGATDNIVRRTIQAYPMDVRERWNYAQGVYRDIDDKDLIEDFVEDDRRQLRKDAKRKVWPGQPINLGNMNRSQALRVLKWFMRLRSDRVWFCELRAMGDSLHVLPGDIVEVSHETYQWDHKLFMVLDANDEADGAGERSFVLQEYDRDNYYFDDDHDAHQRATPPAQPDPFAPPPVIADLDLTQVVVDELEETVGVGIEGVATFAGFTGQQRGRVWYKLATASEWTYSGIRLNADTATGEDVFLLRNLPAGNYHIKVVSESLLGARRPFAEHPVFPFTLTPLPAPANVGGFTIEKVDRHGIRLRWTASTDPTVTGYVIERRDGTGAWAERTRVSANTWTDPRPPAAATVDFRIKALARGNRQSAAYTTTQFTKAIYGTTAPDITLTSVTIDQIDLAVTPPAGMTQSGLDSIVKCTVHLVVTDNIALFTLLQTKELEGRAGSVHLSARAADFSEEFFPRIVATYEFVRDVGADPAVAQGDTTLLDLASDQIPTLMAKDAGANAATAAAGDLLTHPGTEDARPLYASPAAVMAAVPVSTFPTRWERLMVVLPKTHPSLPGYDDATGTVSITLMDEDGDELMIEELND